MRPYMIKRKLAQKQKAEERGREQLKTHKLKERVPRALAKKQAKEEKDRKFIAMTQAIEANYKEFNKHT